MSKLILFFFRAQICPEMFSVPSLNDKLNIDRCMRFLPHYNDDGGFFVAILRKTRQSKSNKIVTAKLDRLHKRHAAKRANKQNNRPVAFSVHDKFIDEKNDFKGRAYTL